MCADDQEKNISLEMQGAASQKIFHLALQILLPQEG